MRILLSSNAGWCHTGFGTQIREIAPRLKASGQEVAVFAFYGLEGGVIEWEGIKYYPKGFQLYGSDILPAHARDFNADVVITLIDVWTLDKKLAQRLKPALWCPLNPLDHYPVPLPVRERLRTAHTTLCYSKWAFKQIARLGLRTRYIPHGVDTAVFKPRPKAEARARLELPRGTFLVGIVAANKGFPSRKCFWQQFEGFANFQAKHDDALLYVHAWPTAEYKGLDLEKLADCYDIGKKVLLPNRYKMHIGFSSEEMADIYNSFDVLLEATAGEGFGLPLIEAQACGTPVISTDFSAMPELTASGWLVPPAARRLTQLYAFQAEPDPKQITERLEEAYESDLEAEGKKAREFALGYDYDKVFATHWTPFLKQLEEDLAPADGLVEV